MARYPGMSYVALAFALLTSIGMAACGEDEDDRAERGQECGRPATAPSRNIECKEGLRCIAHGMPAANPAEMCIETRTVRVGEPCTGRLVDYQPVLPEDLTERLCPEGAKCFGDPRVCQ